MQRGQSAIHEDDLCGLVAEINLRLHCWIEFQLEVLPVIPPNGIFKIGDELFAVEKKPRKPYNASPAEVQALGNLMHTV